MDDDRRGTRAARAGSRRTRRLAVGAARITLFGVTHDDERAPDRNGLPGLHGHRGARLDDPAAEERSVRTPAILDRERPHVKRRVAARRHGIAKLDIDVFGAPDDHRSRLGQRVHGEPARVEHEDLVAGDARSV